MRPKTRRHRHDRAMEMQLKGYRLSTAEITYRMPDHPDLLQTFIWQFYDLAPHFPELRKFLNFWRRDIEGPLHSVRVMHRELIGAGRYRNVEHSFALH